MQQPIDNQDWGRLFVTRRCCGAATCRNYAPELLGEVPSAQERIDNSDNPRAPAVLPGSYEEGAFTGVLRQPSSKADLEAARTAVAACPFGAIQLKPNKSRVRPGELGSPWRAFPRLIEENVWAVGRPSPKNIGALSYFIELPGGGVLIDPPKPSDDLFRWLDEHGGVRYLFLTHRDHTAHHAAIAARFPGCRRVIGAADVNARATPFNESTADVEIKLGHDLPALSLEGAPIPEQAITETDLVVVPQPGHTRGSLCLLHRGKFLFTGDHLSYSHHLGHIVAFRVQCWDDWALQTSSVRRLAALAEAGHLKFTWILPGHGEWHRIEGDGSSKSTATALRRAVAWMERRAPGHVSLARFIPFAQSRTKPKSALARIVRAIGGDGAGSDAWLLPAAARPALPDYDPRKTAAALRRVYVLSAAALAITAGVVGLAARGVLRATRPRPSLAERIGDSLLRAIR